MRGQEGGGKAEAGQEAGRARSCSYTAKVRRCRAKVSEELAGAVAPVQRFVLSGRILTMVPRLSGMRAGAAWAGCGWRGP